MRLSLPARQAVAELIGSAGLVCVVIGSGIAAQRLSPGDTGLQLLENALATGAGLVVLIMAFGPISGAHLNPAVTLSARLLGQITTRRLAVYLPAQLVGGGLGAIAANLMFGLPPITISARHRTGAGLWLAETLATFGLIMLIFALVRTGQERSAPFAVGAYITAAYWWSASTSFANPMIDTARTLSDTFAGIAPASVPLFVAAQLLGAGTAIAVVTAIYPPLPDTNTPPVHEPTAIERGVLPTAE
jgi:arsenate reductase